MSTRIDFSQLGLSEPVKLIIDRLGWTQPTPIQRQCLPITLKGRDLAGFAQTGTGKTGVFLMTMAHRLQSRSHEKASKLSQVKPQAVVLVPTRELAMQIVQDAKPIMQALHLEACAVYGGVDLDTQFRELQSGCDVVVATPGRLKDLVQRKKINLSEIKIFVCDEADRMFEMGFIEDVEFFLEKIPSKAQKLLFSATTNEDVKELAFEYLDNPEYVSITPEQITPEAIEQIAYICESKNKLKLLIGLLRDLNPDCSIVFTNTKLTAEWLHFKLTHNGIECDIITGDLPQRKRISLIKKIKQGKIKALIATDVASRGLHISRVTHVFNFDLPEQSASYIHRIGRTARAGAWGVAISFVCEDYGHCLEDINKLLGEKLALKAQWYDERYDEIVDQAGNPFRPQAHENPLPSKTNKSKSHNRKANRTKKRQKPQVAKDSRPVKGSSSRKSRDISYSKKRKKKNMDHHVSNRARDRRPQSQNTDSKVTPESLPQGGVTQMLKKFIRTILG